MRLRPKVPNRPGHPRHITKDEAAAVSRRLLNISVKIDQSISDAMNVCSPERFNEYRRLAGQILGNIYLYMLKPLLNEYPDLQPEVRNDPAPPVRGEISEEIVELMNQVTSALQHVRAMPGVFLTPYFEEGETEVQRAIGEVRQFVEGWRDDLATPPP